MTIKLEIHSLFKASPFVPIVEKIKICQSVLTDFYWLIVMEIVYFDTHYSFTKSVLAPCNICFLKTLN